jgi:hypothetical protein
MQRPLSGKALTLAAAVVLASVGAAAAQDGPIVAIDAGVIRGVASDNVLARALPQ